MYLLNRYALALVGAYIPAVLVMEYGVSSNWTEGVIITLPVIGFLILWSETIKNRLDYKKPISRNGSFYRDFFIINYATVLAFVVSLWFQGNNVDAKGWWPVIIFIGELYGLALGLAFAATALLLNRQHLRYTTIFAVIMFATFSTLSLIPSYINIILLGQVHTFTVCVFLLSAVHLLACFGYQIKKGVSKYMRRDN